MGNFFAFLFFNRIIRIKLENTHLEVSVLYLNRYVLYSKHKDESHTEGREVSEAAAAAAAVIKFSYG